VKTLERSSEGSVRQSEEGREDTLYLFVREDNMIGASIEEGPALLKRSAKASNLWIFSERRPTYVEPSLGLLEDWSLCRLVMRRRKWDRAGRGYLGGGEAVLRVHQESANRQQVCLSRGDEIQQRDPREGEGGGGRRDLQILAAFWFG
jgi:hypothetical protein